MSQHLSPRRGSAAALISALVLAGLGAVGLAPPSAATGGWHSFSGTGFGPIPDGSGGCVATGNREVTFSVSGVPAGQLADVRITGLALAHNYVGDLTVTLIAPGGVFKKVIFDRTGAATAAATGDSSNLAGPYTFTDDATPASGGWWEAAQLTSPNFPVPAGDYFATTLGGDATSGAATSITGAFSGLADANGTWTLVFVDRCTPDAGSVSAATLELRVASEACAYEQIEATYQGQQVAAATTARNAAQRAKQRAATKAAAKTRAVSRARTAVRRADGPQQVAKAKARLATAVLAQAKAKGALALASQRRTAAQTTLTRAQNQLLRAQDLLASCQDESALD